MEQRIIKFRAWDLNEKKMFLVDKLSETEWVLYLSDAIKGKGRPVFQQFTGLLDKNGKEIYEGDIVHLEQWNPHTYEVLFDRGGFCFRIAGDTDANFYNDCKYLEDCEIVGNIYENPNLLK